MASSRLPSSAAVSTTDRTSRTHASVEPLRRTTARNGLERSDRMVISWEPKAQRKTTMQTRYGTITPQCVRHVTRRRWARTLQPLDDAARHGPVVRLVYRP